ncbi:MAG: hypothetical protein QOE79_359 [Sphingomonadales bacterium]|jgi:hypothetical protein|nr:hypothetical protein [Sphingomonadales bacterium]MEA3050266.1 hypothetical protein [Sphingomonadales bacterium]
MIARGFKSVIWVAAVGGAALGCYMVSLRVATERADLARVEGQILAAKGEIRSLQTELGTRGRMTQLEDWNSNVLALSAPSSAQFVRDPVALARLERHEPTVAEQSAEVRMASAETGAAAVPADPDVAAPAAPAAAKPAPRVVTAVAPAPPPPQPTLVHQASYTPATSAKLKPAATAPVPPEKKPAKPATIAAAKPVKTAPATAAKPDRPAPATAAKPDRPAPVRVATAAKPDKPAPAPAKAKPGKTAAAAAVPAKTSPRTASAAAPSHGGKGGGSSGR